jgi:hypothetical protein
VILIIRALRGRWTADPLPTSSELPACPGNVRGLFGPRVCGLPLSLSFGSRYAALSCAGGHEVRTPLPEPTEGAQARIEWT